MTARLDSVQLHIQSKHQFLVPSCQQYTETSCPDDFVAEAGRKRVFLLLARSTFRFPELREISAVA